MSYRTAVAVLAVSLPDIMDTRREKLSAIHDAVSASFSSGSVRIDGIAGNSIVRIIDTRGRSVATTSGMQRRIDFNNKPGGVYVVMIDDNDISFVRRMVVP